MNKPGKMHDFFLACGFSKGVHACSGHAFFQSKQAHENAIHHFGRGK
jgi:hypothetical protein